MPQKHGSLNFLQVKSLATQLTALNTHHGDSAKIDLIGVGIRIKKDGTGLIFLCPTFVKHRHWFRHDSSVHDKNPMPSRVSIDDKSKRSLLLAGTYVPGFIKLSCRVAVNRVIHLSDLEIEWHIESRSGDIMGAQSFVDFLSSEEEQSDRMMHRAFRYAARLVKSS